MKLLSSEKKALFHKLTQLMSAKLQKIAQDKTYTDIEIAELTKIYPTRLTAIRYYQDPTKKDEDGSFLYDKIIPEKHVVSFIQEGFLTVKEIYDTIELSEKEKQYIDRLIIFENKSFIAAAIKAYKMGIDPAKILIKELQSY